MTITASRALAVVALIFALASSGPVALRPRIALVILCVAVIVDN